MNNTRKEMVLNGFNDFINDLDNSNIKFTSSFIKKAYGDVNFQLHNPDGSKITVNNMTLSDNSYESFSCFFNCSLLDFISEDDLKTIIDLKCDEFLTDSEINFKIKKHIQNIYDDLVFNFYNEDSVIENVVNREIQSFEDLYYSNINDKAHSKMQEIDYIEYMDKYSN